jgi:threonylcarbamoyladenosine tRNA methylthiotransferase MtaB
VLTGVDLTSWGADLPGAPRLGDLVMRILRWCPTCRGCDQSSIDSIEADENLMRPSRRAAPDAASAPVAAAWRRPDPEADEAPAPARRRHPLLPAEARRLRPDMTFGADIIAGFPTETEAHFA